MHDLGWVEGKTSCIDPLRRRRFGSPGGPCGEDRAECRCHRCSPQQPRSPRSRPPRRYRSCWSAPPTRRCGMVATSLSRRQRDRASSQSAAAVGKLIELIPQFLPGAARVAAMGDRVPSRNNCRGRTLIAACAAWTSFGSRSGSARSISVPLRADRSKRSQAVVVIEDGFSLPMRDAVGTSARHTSGIRHAAGSTRPVASYGADRPGDRPPYVQRY